MPEISHYENKPNVVNNQTDNWARSDIPQIVPVQSNTTSTIEKPESPKANKIQKNTGNSSISPTAQPQSSKRQPELDHARNYVRKIKVWKNTEYIKKRSKNKNHN